MTIKEAIEFEKAEIKGERQLYNNGGFAEYHEQLVKWLEELKDYRDKNKMVVKVDVMNIQELKDKVLEAYEKGCTEALDKFSKWLVKYKVISDGAMEELIRDFKGEQGWQDKV